MSGHFEKEKIENGIALYNALFQRFVQFMQNRKFNRCIILDGTQYHIDFTVLHSLHDELPKWSEWSNLQGWLSEHTDIPMLTFYALRQFSVLANEFNLVTITPVYRQRQICPELTAANLDQQAFIDVVLGGHSFGTVHVNEERLILIQGLVIKEAIQIEGLGTLLPIDETYTCTHKRLPIKQVTQHLYCGFKTSNSDFKNRPALVALMATLRTHKCAKPGDIKYAGFVETQRNITGTISYSAGAHSVAYEEETALFGSRAPQLAKMGLPAGRRLPQHFSAVFNTFQDNIFAAEMLNRALLGPKHLRIPLLFNALEALFVNGDESKKYAIAAMVAYSTDGKRSTADFMIDLYNVRNNLVHGEGERAAALRAEILEKREQYGVNIGIEERLTEIVLAVFRNLMQQGWSPKESSKKMRASIFKTSSDLRKVLHMGFRSRKNKK